MDTSSSRPLPPEKFEEIYSQVPRLCVDLVIRKDNGIVLSLRTLPTWTNQWHTPGSMVLYREKIDDAIARTALHEVGLQVKPVKFLDYMEFFSEEQERGFGYSVSMAFLCDYVSGELRPDDNAAEVRVFQELPDNIIAEQREMLEKHWNEIEIGK